MGWTSPDSFATRLFSGDPIIILFALVVTITLPVLLHLYFYTTAVRVQHIPTFLLLGPSGSGKTSLVSLLQKRSSNVESEGDALTRTTQISSTVNITLPTSIPLGSNKYRSENDQSVQEAAKNPTPYRMIDTPGHGKLRLEHALAQLTNPAIRGIIFVVDAAALDSTDSSVLRDTATYLHDALLTLQKKAAASSKGKSGGMQVLVAANKQDLFTALPAGAIKERLQTEIERVKTSKLKGISAVDSKLDMDDEAEVLGGGGEEKFSFKMLNEEYEINVEVVGGAVREGEAGKGVRRWEEWIGGCL